jgi:NAD(P)-dependent dehydrogenase (short-subunit alcohol dehydrogenase family)
MKEVILITGASGGLGALTARRLAKAGYTVYASMRETSDRNVSQVKIAERFAAENNVDLRAIDLDGTSPKSVEATIRQIVSERGRLDVVIHNSEHVVFGPTEAFAPEQLAELYEVNVLSAQRINRVALPVLRKRGRGLVIWVGSSSARGGTPPYLGPYFAAKAGMDALAVSYAGELARWNIETTIVVPGAFTSDTSRLARYGSPRDRARSEEYASGPTAGLARQVMRGFGLTAPTSPYSPEVAEAIVRVVDMPFGTRPFRVHIDPDQDGAHIEKYGTRRPTQTVPDCRI